MNDRRSTYRPFGHALSEREQDILRLVVLSFVDTAGPVGSRYLSKRYPLGLSPASIRNTMSDLEAQGYLDHPHTSAGRVPTVLGYRAFVDQLMESAALSPAEKEQLQVRLHQLLTSSDEMLRESSRLLSQLSNLLGVALTPRLSTGVLERLDVVPLSSSRLMFVLSVRGGLVKTIVLEFEATVRREDVEYVVPILNERLAGLTLEEIRRSCEARTRDLDADPTGLVQFILRESSTLFSEPAQGRFLHGGTQQIMQQPEFQEPGEIRELVRLIEDEEYVVHLLEDQSPRVPQALCRAVVSIGSENVDEQVERYSIVTAQYKLGDTIGTVGVIGPTRMDYARVVALVEGMAVLLSRPPDGVQH